MRLIRHSPKILTGSEANELLCGNDWKQLYFQCPESLRNPYFSPSWVEAWLRTFGVNRQNVVLTVTDEKGVLLAAWPFFEVRAIAGKGLWPVGAEVSDNFHPLVRETNDPNVQNAFRSAFNRLLNDFCFVWLPLIPSRWLEGEGARLLPCSSPHTSISRPIPRILQRPRTPNYLLRFPKQNPEHWLKEKLTKKSRYNLRREQRLLQEQGNLNFKRWTDPQEIQDLIPVLFAIEGKSWKGKSKVGHFSRPEMRAFYRESLPAMARHQLLAVDALCLGDRLIAFELAVIEGSWRRLHAMAFLPEFANFSPGKQLLMHTLQKTWHDGLCGIDFLQGALEYKERLATHTEQLTDLSLFASNWRGLLNFAAVKLANRKTRPSKLPK